MVVKAARRGAVEKRGDVMEGSAGLERARGALGMGGARVPLCLHCANVLASVRSRLRGEGETTPRRWALRRTLAARDLKVELRDVEGGHLFRGASMRCVAAGGLDV